MPTLHDPFEKFLRQIAPLMQSPKFPSLKKSPPLYESLEIACVAARHGSEWILISGRAALKVEPCVSRGRLVPLVRLKDLIALQGCIPAERVKNLVADLRDSWVVRALKRDNVRLRAKRARGYSWMPPYVIESSGPIWRRAFALHGNGPPLSSLLSDSALQKIDSHLRSSTPAFNGFDGLCERLGLPVRRSNLTSWFQLSAELPAVIWTADLEPSKGYFDFTFWCFGAPDLMVEWFPQRVLQRISPDRISLADDPQVPRIASIPIADDSTAAKLILSFGKLDADVVTVDLSPLELQLEVTNTIQLEVVPEEPTVPGFVTREVPNQKLPPSIYQSKIKQAIQGVLSRKPLASDLEVVRELDKREEKLPRGWKKTPDSCFFAETYLDRGLRHRIETEISKVRGDMRKRGIR